MKQSLHDPTRLWRSSICYLLHTWCNSLVVDRSGGNFKCVIFRHILMIDIYLEHFQWNCLKDGTRLSWWCQHWLRSWLGVIRQQAITWTNVDPVLYRNMGQWDKQSSIKSPSWITQKCWVITGTILESLQMIVSSNDICICNMMLFQTISTHKFYGH